jgi:uncharacterized protein YkwD
MIRRRPPAIFLAIFLAFLVALALALIGVHAVRGAVAGIDSATPLLLIGVAVLTATLAQGASEAIDRRPMNPLAWIAGLFRPRPRPPAPPPGPVALPSDVAAAVLVNINAERTRRGIAAVSDELRLAAAAQGHAEDLARRDQPLAGVALHYGSDSSTMGARIGRQGYTFSAIGEVAAPGWFATPGIAGQAIDPVDVVQRWLDDSLHRNIMLDRRFTQAGVGVATAQSGTGYAVVDFGTPIG